MHTFKKLLVTLLVVGLVGAVGVLLSELNARTFRFEQAGDALVVHKGRRFVVGSSPYRPADAALADAYAPVPVGGADVSGLLGERFREREELDRALFGLLETLARPKMASDDPQTLDQGLYLLRRAEKLTGLTEEQRLTLKRLQADVAYYQARNKFEDARKLVVEALGQLKLAAEAENRHSRSAHQMISFVEPVAHALSEALRKAVHSQSAPASGTAPQQAPSPAPQPPQPDDAPPPTPETR